MGLAVAAVALTVAAGAAKTFAAKQQADAQADNAKFQQEEAEQNLQFERAATSVEEGRSRRFARRRLATNRARVGASGVRADVGSPLDFAIQNAFELESEILNNRISGQLRQRQFASQATNARFRRKTIETQARLGVAAGVLSTAGSAIGTGTRTGLVK